MPFKMSLVADVAPFLKGTKDAEAGVERLSGSLEDLAKDAQRSGDKAETALEGVGNEAKAAATTTETATDKMERSFRDAFDSVKREAKAAGDVVDRETRSGTDRGGAAIGDFKQEATSNLSEVASSFSGDMTSAVDLVQGTLGGLANIGIPGLGVAFAGLGIAVGTIFSQMSADAEAMKEKVASYFEDMRQSGLDFATEQMINDNIATLVQDEGKAAEAARVAEAANTDLALALRAMAGDASAAGEVKKGLNDALATEKAKMDDVAASMGGLSNMTDAQKKQYWDLTQAYSDNIGNIEAQIGVIDKESGAWATSKTQIDNYRGAVALVTDSTKARDYIAGITGAVKEMGDAYDKAREKAANSWAAVYGASGAGGAPRRAGGGDVTTGRSYLVGENEPEVFVPGQSGTVLNQAQIIQAMGRQAPTLDLTPRVPQRAPQSGGGITVEIANITAADPDAAMRAIRRELQFMQAGHRL